MKMTLTVVVALTLAPAPFPSADWQQWGGPRRDFTVDSGALLATNWPPEGPKRLWSRTLGEGHSSVLVEGGRLYTMYRPGGLLSTVRRSQQEVITALDAATGRTIWERTYQSSTSGLDLQYGAGPHSTPLIVGNRLFAIGSRKELFALDKQSGKVLWSHDLEKEFGSPPEERGFAPSPIAYGKTIILPVGGRGQAVMAFDQQTGAVAWKKHDFDIAPASPVLIEVSGQPQLVVFGGREIVGMNPARGDVLWRHPHETSWRLNISTPVWGEGNLLLLSSAYGSGTRVLQLTETTGTTAVKELWFNNRLRVHIGNVIRIGDYAYASNGDFGPSFITAINIRTGQIGWRDRSFARASFLHVRQRDGAPTGRLLILDEDGTLGLADVTPKGITILSRAELMKKTAWTVPTLDGTRLYARDRGGIAAFELGR